MPLPGPADAPPVRHGAEPRGLELPARERLAEGRFGLMFKHLPAFAPPDELLLGLAAGMAEPAGATPGALDNPAVPSGFVFLGQFIDHDLTFDPTPLPEQQTDPDALTNFRSARYDLDAVYGLGPAASPELYDPDDGAKLRLARLGGAAPRDDLPRRPDGRALLGDPRNDENLLLSQLHLAFLKFHNALVDRLRAGGAAPGGVFEAARRLCRWHFQWVVVHDFLPRVVGEEVVGQLLEERAGKPAKLRLDFYKPKNPNRPMLPVEFAAAAYRFGHSTIRPAYRINGDVGAAFFEDVATDRNLNGGRPLPPTLVVEWRHFFDLPGLVGAPANASRRIDGRLAGPLFRLPASVVPPPDPRVSLAERNLLRGKRLGLPSGQDVAQAMGVPALSNRELGLGEEPGWGGEAPLWFYVLKEAELRAGGARLGPVGGRIVAEVLLGLLDRDRGSYLSQEPGFRPAPPIAPAPGRFAMGDLLRFAGVA
jgi:hypothetical protein